MHGFVCGLQLCLPSPQAPSTGILKPPEEISPQPLQCAGTQGQGQAERAQGRALGTQNESAGSRETAPGMGGKERGLPKAGPTFSVATVCAPLPRDWSRVAACDVIGLHAHVCLSPRVCVWVPLADGQRGPTGRTVLERAEALPCCQTGQAWGGGDTVPFSRLPCPTFHSRSPHVVE